MDGINMTNTVTTEANGTSETAMLKELVERMEKQLLFTKVLAIASCLVAVILLIVAFVVVPPTVATLNNAKDVMISANTTMEQAAVAITTAEDALQNVTSMSNNITTTSQNLNQFVMDNAETMSDAMKDISSIDFAGLNTAIKDLQDAVGPFANLMRKFN